MTTTRPITSPEASVELLVAAIAAVVAVFGYLLSQFASRRERRATAFAEALATVAEYEELPYLIRRRPAADEATRWSLAEQISDVQVKLSFHLAWLESESKRVAEKYRALVDAARAEAGSHMKSAWTTALIESDEGMNLRRAYTRDSADAARKSCVGEMRRGLNTWWLWPAGVLISSLGLLAWAWWSTG